MRGVTWFVWSVVSVFALALPSAHAAEHEGEGFRVRAPHGFRVLSAEDAAMTLAHDLDLVGRLAPPSALSRTVFLAGQLSDPDAVLLVARIDVDPDQFASSRTRHRYLLDRVRVTDEEFESLVADGGVVLRATDVGGHEALEMTHAGVEGPLGLVEPAGAAVLIDADDHVILLALMVRDTTVYPVEETWSQIRGGLTVEPPVAFARTMLLYGGMALGGLIVLVLLARLLGMRRRHASQRFESAGGLSMSAEGWGTQRPSVSSMQPALDREPASGMPSPLDQPLPDVPPQAAADTASGLGDADDLPLPAAPPRTTARTLPKAPPADPTPLRAQDPAAPSPGPTSTPPASAPPATPTADDDTSDTSALPPPARPAARKRAGLKRTLPSNGRYSG